MPPWLQLAMPQNAPSPLAVITGAGGGLAPATARAFSAAGYRLALVTRPGGEQAAEELARELGADQQPGSAPGQGKGASTVGVYGIDLAAPDTCSAGFAVIERELGPVSVL